MSQEEKLAIEVLHSLSRRGMDFLTKEAIQFFLKHQLQELTSSQLMGLASEVYKGRDFSELEKNGKIVKESTTSTIHRFVGLEGEE